MSAIFFNITKTEEQIKNFHSVGVEFENLNGMFFLNDEVKNIENGIYLGYYGFVVINDNKVIFVGNDIKNEKNQTFLSADKLLEPKFCKNLKNWNLLYE